MIASLLCLRQPEEAARPTGFVARMTKCLARQWEDLQDTSFSHDSYEKTDCYGTNDISSITLKSLQYKQLLEDCWRGKQEKNKR